MSLLMLSLNLVYQWLNQGFLLAAKLIIGNNCLLHATLMFDKSDRPPQRQGICLSWLLPLVPCYPYFLYLSG
jgi:hypothetical protein